MRSTFSMRPSKDQCLGTQQELQDRAISLGQGHTNLQREVDTPKVNDNEVF